VLAIFFFKKCSYLVFNGAFSRISLTVTIRSSLILSWPPGTEGSQGLVSILGAAAGGVPAAARAVGCWKLLPKVGLDGW
jgi:hypothetical protein